VLNEYTEKLYPDLDERRKQNDLAKKARIEQERLEQTQTNVKDPQQVENATQQVNNDKIKHENDQTTVDQVQEEVKQQELTKDQADEETKEDKPVKSMAQLIQDEISELKKDQVFYVFDLKLQSLIFIKISDPYKDIIDVKALGAAIIHDVFEEQKYLTRFCLRFMPILFVCKASNVEHFKSLATNELDAYFGALDGVKWSMEWKNRGNQSVKRIDVLDFVYNQINKTGSGNSVDLSNPDHSVIVEVCMDVVLFSILPGFKKYRRYNISNPQDDKQNRRDAKQKAKQAEDVQHKEEEKAEDATEDAANKHEDKVAETAAQDANPQTKEDAKEEESSDGDIDLI